MDVQWTSILGIFSQDKYWMLQVLCDLNMWFDHM